MGWDIVGHEWVIASLQHSIRSGRDAHAYLISGPDSVGKRLLALRMAQAWNCEQQSGEPCRACRTCQRIERGNYPDVRIASMETQAAGLKSSEANRQKDLKIGTIREWQRDIALKPYEGRRRVFILHDAERLNEEASNAMLKTLEEPPPFAALILVASTSNLLPTIVSRCQHIRLRPLPRRQVAQALLDMAGLDNPQATLLAAWSSGRMGWALRMAQAPQDIETRRTQLDELRALHQQPRSTAFRWAEDRNKEYRGGEQHTVIGWLELWQSWWHDVMLVAAGCPEYITHVDYSEELQREARQYPLDDVYRFVARIGESIQQLRSNVNPQLALENLFLHLPVPQAGMTSPQRGSPAGV